MRSKKKENTARGTYAKKYRPSKAERRVQDLVERARRPFERLCLLRWSFTTRERAARSAGPGQRPTQCPWCGNWHLRYKGGRP